LYYNLISVKPGLTQLKIVDFIKKLQKQPEHIRKIILWSVVIIVGLVLVVLWIHNSYQEIKNLQSKEIIKEQWISNIEQHLK